LNYVTTIPKSLLLISVILFSSCKKEEEESSDNSSNQVLDTSRSECNVSLSDPSTYTERNTITNRVITANSIRNHKVGLFGTGVSSINAISPQSESYTITVNQVLSSTLTPLLQSIGQGAKQVLNIHLMSC